MRNELNLCNGLKDKYFFLFYKCLRFFLIINLCYLYECLIQLCHHLNFLSVLGFEMLFKRLGFEDVQVETPGQLDVDIVTNALKEDPSISIDRFVRLLLHRNGLELANFQEFLVENRLSSHCRIFAQKNRG